MIEERAAAFAKNVFERATPRATATHTKKSAWRRIELTPAASCLPPRARRLVPTASHRGAPTPVPAPQATDG
eukprot:6122251-Prymnesium_polylepis.1